MQLESGIFIALFLLLIVSVLIPLVIWARRRSKGAVVSGALLSVFAPDPTLEASIRLTEESKQQQKEEDEEGEPK
jgi:hypothetical protein